MEEELSGSRLVDRAGSIAEKAHSLYTNNIG